MPSGGKFVTGWGLAYQGGNSSWEGRDLLYATDGSARIYQIDVEGWEEIAGITARDEDFH